MPTRGEDHAWASKPEAVPNRGIRVTQLAASDPFPPLPRLPEGDRAAETSLLLFILCPIWFFCNDFPWLTDRYAEDPSPPA